MLDRGKITIICICAILIESCSNSNLEKEKSLLISGKSEYITTYRNLCDSVANWTANKLGLYTFEKGKFEYQIDSLLCFNKSFDRVIACILMQTIEKPSSSDGIIYMYGEKTNDKWYFARGASIVIPRSMVAGHPENEPLSYQQLHEIALKEVYSGYLNAMGNINEDWFKMHFENIGMCADCKTSEDFKKNFLQGAQALWSHKDTTKSP